jgi:hypothetical protein
MQDYETVPSNRVLIPVTLIGLVLFLTLAFQMVQVMRDRDTLRAVYEQQNQPLTNGRKLGSQLSNLAIGTKKLAEGGDKYATAIVTRLQQMGISIDANAPNMPGGAPPAGGQPPAAAQQPTTPP